MRSHYWLKLSPFLILLLFLSVRPFFHKTGLAKTNVTELAIDNGPNYPESDSGPAFTFYEGKHIFPTASATQMSVNAEQSKLFENVKEIAATHLQTSKSNFKYGMYRLLSEGLEFSLYFELDGNLRRVSVFQPLGAASHIHDYLVEEPVKVVNIVLTLQKKLKPLTVFLDHLVNQIYPKEKDITLTVVYFSDSAAQKAKALMSEKLKAIPTLKWWFVLLEETKFSRGRGLQVGVEHLSKKDSDLLFLCDIDILVSPDFFGRCRTNTLQTRQVYYPIVFSLYNPEVVYAARGEPLPSLYKQAEVGSDNGFWRDFGFGMACMYRSELNTAGGMPDIKSWGGEDLKLHNILKATPNIKVIRVPDPGLVHVYHKKNCTNVAKDQMGSCLLSKVTVEGSQIQLGLSLFKLNESIDVATALKQRYRQPVVDLFRSGLPLAFAFVILIIIVLFYSGIYKYTSGLTFSRTSV